MSTKNVCDSPSRMTFSWQLCTHLIYTTVSYRHIVLVWESKYRRCALVCMWLAVCTHCLLSWSYFAQFVVLCVCVSERAQSLAAWCTKSWSSYYYLCKLAGIWFTHGAIPRPCCLSMFVHTQQGVLSFGGLCVHACVTVCVHAFFRGPSACVWGEGTGSFE